MVKFFSFIGFIVLAFFILQITAITPQGSSVKLDKAHAPLSPNGKGSATCLATAKGIARQNALIAHTTDV
ncbi:hypothetical protein CASFOL_031314 [Castilleja foliolosa]|uniref:Uncharacterized protein n=1 Tax=Castilleja foliolosa TaxID=1961234 RepID=A0ABD3C5N0_9LAMI